MEIVKNMIILCGTQRCGSTMVVADLRATGVLGNPEEYFIPWTTQEIKNPLENFSSILTRASTSNGNASIKVMADQLDDIERNLAESKEIELEESELNFLYPHVRKIFKNAIFVKINRLDIIAQAVSRLMSLKTGKNHYINENSSYQPGNNTVSNTDYNNTVEYNKLYLDEQAIEISKENSKWDCVLKNWNLERPINLVYEHCIDDLSYLYTIGKKLGLEIDFDSLPDRQIKKIGNEKNDYFIQRYSFDEETSFLKKSEVDLLRDAAVSVENNNVNLARNLMSVAYRFRPSGLFIKKKLEEYKESLK